ALPYLLVLCTGFCVAGAPVADLVARQQQRNAVRQHQGGELVAPDLPAPRDDVGVVGRALDTTIGADVVVRAVAILFAVHLVVLLGVADQVGEREPVVHGDVVDAGGRAAPAAVEQVG